MADEKPPLLLPREALAFFRAKGIAFSFDWEEVWQEEHAKAFTVAKAMSRDLLEDIRAAVDDAIEGGETLAMFRKKLTPLLIQRGWWGRKAMTDPLTGEERTVQLGSPRRLATIYRTNMRTAYHAGRWQRIQRQKRVFPYLIYTSVMDGRERPQHRAWHNTVLPVDHAWWETHYPPCGWNCRCTARPANARMLDRRRLQVTSRPARNPMKKHVNRRTGEVTELEEGIDPGWSYNVGAAALDGLPPPPLGSAGEEGAVNAFSPGDKKRLSAFFSVFDIDLGQAPGGKVWRDATDWPLALSPGLFRGPDGVTFALPASAELAAIARAVAQPDAIYWRWVTAKNGRAMLMRRYVGADAIAEFGGSLWRWHVGDPARYRTGALVWTRR